MPTTQIPYLKVTGNSYKIGFQIGKHFKSNIQSILEEFTDFTKHKKRYPEKKSYLQEILNISEKACPAMIEEIRGIADGSGIDFQDLFIHNCMHMPYWAHCSTSILRTDDTIYIAHNEDAHPFLEKYAYFVFIQPDNPDLIPFFSHCYPGIVPGMSYGFNMNGIVQTCNSLPDPTKSVGIPRMFVGRTIYEKAKSISEAIKIIDSLKPRSGGASYTLGSMHEQEIVNVETTGIDYSVIKIKNHLFRANHYISEKFKHYPAASDHTLVRQSRGEASLPKIREPSELINLMWDDSIYLTMEGTNNDCQTNSTLIFEITENDITMKDYSDSPNLEYKTVEYCNFL